MNQSAALEKAIKFKPPEIPPNKKRAFWAVIIGITGGVLISSSDEALKHTQIPSILQNIMMLPICYYTGRLEKILNNYFFLRNNKDMLGKNIAYVNYEITKNLWISVLTSICINLLASHKFDSWFSINP